jgi:hypothetical protein
VESSGRRVQAVQKSGIRELEASGIREEENYQGADF